MPAGTAPLSGDVIVGVVNGTVLQDTEYHRFWGIRVLVSALVLAGVAIAIRAVRDGATIGASLARGLFPGLIVLLFLGGIYAFMFGISPRRYAGGLCRGARRTAAGLGRAAAHGAAAGVRGGAGAVSGTSVTERELTIRRFRVQTMTGDMYSCLLRGELIGDDVRQGDFVRVRGRRHRSGVHVVKTVEILASPAGATTVTISCRPPAGFAAARFAHRLGVVTGVIVLLWSANLVLGALQ